LVFYSSSVHIRLDLESDLFLSNSVCIFIVSNTHNRKNFSSVWSVAYL
jgi:hypothetical protein